MSSNIAQFQNDLDLFANTIVPSAHVNLQRQIVVKMYQLVAIENTEMIRHPIDTGWAQRNWRISVMSFPPANVLGARSDAKQDHNKHTGGAFTENQLRAQMTHLRPYQVVWIFNNVHYMQALEEGHSRLWAPHGIVAPALLDIEAYIASL